MIHYIVCFVDFRSDAPLERVAEQISEHLFGGVQFGSREDYIMDEVPAVYALKDIGGLRVVIHGYGGDDGYTLEIRPRRYLLWHDMSKHDFLQARVDITEYITCLLRNLGGIKIMTD